MRAFLKFACFCIVGVTSNLIDLGIFNLFLLLLNFNSLFFGVSLNFIIAAIAGIIISIIYSFFINRNITFSAQNGPIKRHFYRYLIIYAIAVLSNLIISFIIIRILGESTFNDNVARISGIILSIPISFFGSLFWVFKE